MNRQFRRANWFCILHIAFLFYVINIFIPDKNIYIYIIEFIIGFIILASTFNIITFKENEIIRFFPFRLFKRNYKYQVSDIIKIKYELPANRNIEALHLYLKSHKKIYIRIDSIGIKKNKTFLRWYYEKGIELDFVDIKHNKFEELEW